MDFTHLAVCSRTFQWLQGACQRSVKDRLSIFLIMSLLRRFKWSSIDKCIIVCRYCSTDKPVNSSKWAETTLMRFQGRMYHWLDAYEDFVGLTEVKCAQEQVTQVVTSC